MEINSVQDIAERSQSDPAAQQSSISPAAACRENGCNLHDNAHWSDTKLRKQQIDIPRRRQCSGGREQMWWVNIVGIGDAGILEEFQAKLYI